MVSYKTWLDRVFGRTARQSTPLFDAEPAMIVELIRQTLVGSGVDLMRFSDKQVNTGLYHIFSNSSIVFALQDPLVPAADRKATILAIKALYTECFAKRARPVLSHLHEKGRSPVNSICYMLWDATPIGSWGHVAGCEYFDLALEVIEFALYLSNPACVESALHGLGHMGNGNSRRVHRIIDQWLAQKPTVRPELYAYAQLAHRGLIR